jgi:hypothetical protein
VVDTAYDCLYLAEAIEDKCRFVTADQALRNVRLSRRGPYREWIIGLAEAAGQA